MGQKINPNIFRLGVNKKWRTEFFEKKRHELPLYTFKDLEIKSYIERFLEKQGIILHDYKQHYSNSTLNLYISYFVLPEFVFNQKNKINRIRLINKLNKNDTKFVQAGSIINSPTVSNSLATLFNTETSMNYYKMRKYSSTHSNYLLLPFKAYSGELRTEGILNNLFKVLSLFTANQFNIIVNFCCLNKNLNFLQKMQTKNFVLLQKFKGAPFFKEGIELLFYTVYIKNSANLLAKFISIQMKKVKRHKFFLSFLKQTLTVLSSFNFSKVKGIKIMIKGRLNGVPRAKHKTIIVGDIPVQSIKETVDYYQTTTHNSNGSYGIKVWIIEKH